MCGIAGGIRHFISEKEKAQVRKSLLHRGPDDDGYWQDGSTWLFNTRLAIQDISHSGHQPMRTDDGRYTLVFNGEIYNHGELRPLLQKAGLHFYSHCDTETLLQAYVHWDADCLARFNGDFAFCVYDASKEELFIARDGMGVKPLYYYQDNDKFLFASEIKALLQLDGIDRTLQPEIFSQYLCFQYGPTADTPFAKIKKLLPGHAMRISLKAAPGVPFRWHSIPMNGRYEHRTEPEWVDALDETLTRAVSRQLLSDRLVGFFLSGGLDSSLIAAIAQKLTGKTDTTAFTIAGSKRGWEGFEDDYRYAEIVARHLNISLQSVSGEILLDKELDTLIGALEEPQADPAALHVAHITSLAKQRGIPVLLGGAGADDIFSGYRRHLALQYAPLLSRLPKSSYAAAASLARASGQKPMFRRMTKLLGTAGLASEDAMIAHHFWTTPDDVTNLFKPALRAQLAAQDSTAYFHALLEEIPQEHNLLNKALFIEQRSFLPQHNLAYLDKMSMANSVESRVPFLDAEVVQLAAEMPPHLKMNGRTTKAILRQVAKRYLPPEIITRPKTGFGAPIREWMAAGGERMARERLLDDAFNQWGFFEQSAIERLIQQNRHKRQDASYTLFSLLCIESWLRQFATGK